MPLVVSRNLVIEDEALEEQFVHASGPGGQNVNKVATAVQLRLDTTRASGLTPAVVERLRRVAGRRMTRDGVVVIEARRFRTRERNREDARARLVDLLRRALEAPKPRVATRPSLAAKRRRLDAKRRQSRLKQARRPVTRSED